jgi:hypothetical protein
MLVAGTTGDAKSAASTTNARRHDMGIATGIRRQLLMVGSISVLALAAVAAPAPTLAKGGGSAIIHTGSCSGASDWKLKVKKDDGQVEVEFEVDQNKNGKTWDVRLKQDGTTFWSGVRTTQAPSGSFSVSKRTTDLAGVHVFVGRAVSRATGEVCRGTASI